jgi:hypothetical protein
MSAALVTIEIEVDAEAPMRGYGISVASSALVDVVTEFRSDNERELLLRIEHELDKAAAKVSRRLRELRPAVISENPQET